jgi:hypothetical protein
LIAGLSSSYDRLLETLKLTGRLDRIIFFQLSELLAQHDKMFGKKKQVDEDVFLTVVSIQVKIQEETVKEEEHKFSIRIKQFQEKSIKGPQNCNDQYRRGRDVS